MERVYYHNINIERAVRGFYVRVGCQTIVYADHPTDIKVLIKDFSEYMLDPKNKENTFKQDHGLPVEAPIEEATLPPNPNPGE